MNLSKAQADAELAEIDDVVRRVKRSRIYRLSGEIAMLWGVLQFVQYAVLATVPLRFDWSWTLVDALGVALTVFWLWRFGLRNGVGPLRALAAFALFYGFGFVWTSVVGHFDDRGTAVFWHTLFLFGYSLAGLWLGVGFLAIGLGLSAAIFAVYLFAGAWFWLLIALVSGLGYILCGLWMRRA